jgi:hypothetical protein
MISRIEKFIQRIIPFLHIRNGLFLRSSSFEGSLDGSNWNELDRQADNPATNHESQIAAFTVSVRAFGIVQGSDYCSL